MFSKSQDILESLQLMRLLAWIKWTVANRVAKYNFVSETQIMESELDAAFMLHYKPKFAEFCLSADLRRTWKERLIERAKAYRKSKVNIWKIFELRKSERYKDMIDYRSYVHNFSSCEI